MDTKEVRHANYRPRASRELPSAVRTVGDGARGAPSRDDAAARMPVIAAIAGSASRFITRSAGGR